MFALKNFAPHFQSQFQQLICQGINLIFSHDLVEYKSRVDPGFSVDGGGAAAYNFATFSENLHDNQKIFGNTGRARLIRTRLIRSST